MSEHAEKGRYLCYEGYPLESVLARVTADHGPGAVITSAEKVRRGGIKGFFARELFQVIVDVGSGDDEEGATPPVDAAGAVRAVDGADIDPEDVEGALALDHLLADRRHGTDNPPPPTEDAELWALLADIAASSSPSWPEPAPERVTMPALASPSDPGTGAGHPGSAFPKTGVDIAALLAVAPPPPVWSSPVPADPPFVTETVEREAIAAELVQPLRSLGPIATTTVIPSSAPSPGSVFGTPFDPFRRPVVPPSEEVRAHGAATASAATVLGGVVQGTSRLGDLLASLEASLPPVPAVPERGVVVIVGERAEAVAAAHRFAEGWDVPTGSVLVASASAGAVPPAPAELAELARRAAAAARPRCVVAVELLAGRDGHEWTRAVVEALDPAQVRFVARAGRYVAHQHLSTAAIGGVDVVDLVGTDELAEPTAALVVGIPIGSLDGRPGSPELWAATLLASRAAVVDPDTRPGADWFGVE